MRTTTMSRISAGIDGFPEGTDAAALATTLTRATGGELMLVSVIADPTLLPPVGVKWRELRAQTLAGVGDLRRRVCPEARSVIETDFSVARGLQRVIGREHRDLLVVGSRRNGPAGKVSIGRTTRQLLGHIRCPLAIAPRGYGTRPEPALKRIGVGYDGSEESQAALAVAATLARAAAASLEIRAVVDDWIPAFGLSGRRGARVVADWSELVADDVERLRVGAEKTATEVGAGKAAVVALSGPPSEILLAFADEVDVIVIGSRRWGAVARVVLGSTGETLVNGAATAVVVVPRLSTDSEARYAESSRSRSGLVAGRTPNTDKRTRTDAGLTSTVSRIGGQHERHP